MKRFAAHDLCMSEWTIKRKEVSGEASYCTDGLGGGYPGNLHCHLRGGTICLPCAGSSGAWVWFCSISKGMWVKCLTAVVLV